MEHRKPTAISRKLDPAKQAAFIKGYEALMNQLSADEAVVFVDAAHPTHAVRPVGCWAPKELPVAVEQSSGRDRLNIHGAIDLETGQTIMKDVLTVDALSTIMLLMAVEAMYPGMRLIHVFLDNARYHHAKLVQAWLARPECRIKLHFIPAYCPHLNPIERLWGLMHRHTTHNKCYGSFKDFSIAMLNFLRDEVPDADRAQYARRQHGRGQPAGTDGVGLAYALMRLSGPILPKAGSRTSLRSGHLPGMATISTIQAAASHHPPFFQS